MAKVKVFLDKNETIEDAELQLMKAMDLHISGDAHDGEDFDDPAMVHVNQKLVNIQKQIYDEMVEEIIMELESQYLGK